nr:MAG TPA_asm: hypothetical protein [Caudoviricetes sp.]
MRYISELENSNFATGCKILLSVDCRTANNIFFIVH